MIRANAAPAVSPARVRRTIPGIILRPAGPPRGVRPSPKTFKLRGIFQFAAPALLLAGCMVGPNYRRPSAPTPPAFKEDAVPPPNPVGGGWKKVDPADSALRGNWWEIYGDPELNRLEEKVAVSNQTLKMTYAQYMQALYAVKAARAQYYPAVSLLPAIHQERFSANRPLFFPGIKNEYYDFLAEGQVAWEPDLWGAVRRAVEAQVATTQASAAQLANVDLSLRAQLAIDYFELRGLDGEQQLLDATVVQDREFVKLTEDRFKGGVANEEDVALAQTELDQTQAQDIDVAVARSQYEHAIATLIGTPASSFSLPPAPIDLALPSVPVGVPSQILERRPDVAEAERQAQAANAQIGIAISAFYPTITLGGVGGFESAHPGNWIQGSSSLWTLGGSAAELLFAGGRRHAFTQEARQGYEASVANYRETVLQAFQEVEDNLASLRILNNESAAQALAVKDSERSLAISARRYRGGVTNYLTVITAQTQELANQITATQIQARQFVSSVLLVEALGGGWDTSKLPKP